MALLLVLLPNPRRDCPLFRRSRCPGHPNLYSVDGCHQVSMSVAGRCCCCHRQRDDRPAIGEYRTARPRRHLGSSPAAIESREKDHFEQYQDDIEIVKQQQRYITSQREEEIRELQASIEALKIELDKRPTRIVKENLDQEEVNEAKRNESDAISSRDDAYFLVARFRALHHDTGRGICKCRVPIGECKVNKLINDDRRFLRWEKRRCDAQGRGQYWARLPEGHPFLINPRWSS